MSASRRQVLKGATAAVAAPRVEVEVLPGSHNNLFTHPERVADTIGRAAARRGLPLLGHG